MISHHGENIPEMLEFYEMTLHINNIGTPLSPHPRMSTNSGLNMETKQKCKCRKLPLTKQTIHFVMPPMSWKTKY